MGSHEAGPARTHMLLVIISSSLSLLDAFWLKPDLFSFRHKIEMMHLSVLPAVTCGIQTITKGRLCDFHQHFENTLYLLSPTGVVFLWKGYNLLQKWTFSQKYWISQWLHVELQFLCWAEPKLKCFAAEQIVLQHGVPLDVFFFTNVPLAFSELKRLFPVLFKAADKLFSMLESICVCLSFFYCTLCILRSRRKLTAVSFC